MSWRFGFGGRLSSSWQVKGWPGQNIWLVVWSMSMVADYSVILDFTLESRLDGW